MSLFPELDIPLSTFNLSKQGAVYTPLLLARWAAEILAEYMPECRQASILDPACGDGALLQAVAQQFTGSLSLFGMDIDHAALCTASRWLPELTSHHANALAVMDTARRECLMGNTAYDAIITNPPWGADPGFTRSQLQHMGYTLANGQFDTYDLFLELSLRLLKTGGVLVAIIPDSLFLPEHEPLRRLLAANGEICLLARLGEGFFEGVFRGTTVVVLRKQAPSPDHQVRCVRLTKEWRRRIQTGAATLSQASRALSHTVRQERFTNDAAVKFDIDMQEDEEEVISKITRQESAWADWFVSGRGVELSKMGRVLRCPSCEYALPVPRIEAGHIICRCCKKPFQSQDALAERFVRPRSALTVPSPDPLWQPLIVGEDVDRYHCLARREIRLDGRGINYKTPETFTKRKLLVRKTGLGIKAAIDDTGAYTNQVVFHYLQKDSAPAFAMDYVLGVLNSRVLLAFHLKSVGETEWRSHPYITQKVIAALPVPQVREGTWQWRQASAIAAAVRQRPADAHPDCAEDLQIERLCAGLFGLNSSDCEWVLQVLDSTQAMEPLRTLRLNNASQIQPVQVA